MPGRSPDNCQPEIGLSSANINDDDDDDSDDLKHSWITMKNKLIGGINRTTIRDSHAN